MFERRLKIFLAVLVSSGLVLFGRAFSLQVLGRDEWARAEQKLTTRPPELTETTRGRILDVHGVPLAVDAPATDACVDYRAIVDPPDPKWVTEIATNRLKARYGSDFSRASHTFTAAQRKAMVADAGKQVVADVNAMWAKLAEKYHPADPEAAALAASDPRAALDEVRRGIVREVELRRRMLWTYAYRKAEARTAQGGRLLRWLGFGGNPSGGTDEPSSGGPDIDSYIVTTGEQQASHVVLHALDADACNDLGKQLERFPGLSLKPSTHRFYPLHDVACHVLGQTSAPSVDQLKLTKDDDPTRQYVSTETDVGREGVEALCEPLLRGVRGRIDRRPGDDAIVSQQDFVPGQDVRLTIDADLQARAQHMLEHVVIKSNKGELVTPADGISMHAAAVVLDVRTNEVRALASNPAFDVNDLATRYSALVGDTLDEPLRNRATSDAMNPGSTAKPLIGIGAITQGVLGAHEGIECTGYLRLPVNTPDGKPTGRMLTYRSGRCWVASEYTLAELYNDTKDWPHPVTSYAHHPIPVPHKGRFGNPDGFLCFSDAIERSCNVFFETTADRLGPGGVDHWLDAFGIGRPTGIGIHESPGLRPSQWHGVPPDPRLANCSSGIGEGTVWATPLQIANVAATLARGSWMRPRLLTAETQARLDAVSPPSKNRPPDVFDLHLDPEGMRQAREGMVAVVDDGVDYTAADGTTRRAYIGTGHIDHPAWLQVAAKTGTAEVSRLTVWKTDDKGNRTRELLQPVTRDGTETATPWYRSNNAKDKTVTQDWYMGYAPADDPQVAFAVLIEYAGSSGGLAGGPVATQLLDACIADGYLHPPGTTAPTAEPASRP
jgi:penicillin-binding protein 2